MYHSSKLPTPQKRRAKRWRSERPKMEGATMRPKLTMAESMPGGIRWGIRFSRFKVLEFLIFFRCFFDCKTRFKLATFLASWLQTNNLMCLIPEGIKLKSKFCGEKKSNKNLRGSFMDWQLVVVMVVRKSDPEWLETFRDWTTATIKLLAWSIA